MTEVPGRPGWVQPHDMPVKLCVMPYLAHRKGTAEGRVGMSNPAGLFWAPEWYAASLETLQVAGDILALLPPGRNLALVCIWLGVMKTS